MFELQAEITDMLVFGQKLLKFMQGVKLFLDQWELGTLSAACVRDINTDWQNKSSHFLFKPSDDLMNPNLSFNPFQPTFE